MATPAERILRCAVLVQQVADAHRRAAADALARHGVAESASGLLWLLGTRGPTTMREAARSLRCDPSNVTLLAGVMERLNLAERVQDPDDRRRRRLQLTDHGHRAYAALTAAVAGTSPLASLTDEQLTSLTSALSASV